MKKSQLIILLGCSISCLLILTALYAFSPISKEVKRSSFERRFANSPPIKEVASMDIDFNSFYIAGASKSEIYLGNITAPFHVLVVTRDLKSSRHDTLSVKLDSLADPLRFKLSVDSPYFFLSHGTMPELLRGRVGEWKAKRFLPDSADYFVEAIPLSPSSFAFRSYSLLQKGYELGKKSSSEPFQFKNDLLQKQIDGLFCVDGQLQYDRDINKLVYVHYYRNEIIVTDSNLNLLYRTHTIDTFRRAKIRIAKVGDKNESMLSAPPRQINIRSCVSGKYLFVQSNLLAVNEEMEKFLNGSVIDVYDLSDFHYLHSFHINDYMHKKPTDIKIFGNNIFVVFDHYLVLYELDHEAFNL